MRFIYLFFFSIILKEKDTNQLNINLTTTAFPRNNNGG